MLVSSLEEFIEKSISKHGDKYDYSDVEYTTTSEKVSIRCNTCDHVFLMAPYNHAILGKGCSKCAKVAAGLRRRIDFTEYVRVCNEHFGEGAYDYTNSIYYGVSQDITVFCNTCQDTFTLNARLHYREGVGCPRCKAKGKERKFIEACNSVFGEGRYDYSNCNYVSSTLPVHVKCNVCDHEFDMQATLHKDKKIGCSKCSGFEWLTTEIFIKRCIAIYGEDRYNYSQVEYVNALTKVKIGCKRCGRWFSQRPSAHYTQGCHRCVVLATADKRRLTTEEFLSRCIAKHGEGKYSYEGVEYLDRNDKITIRCNTCGNDVTIKTWAHILGGGCKKCNPGGFYKVGITNRNITKRFKHELLNGWEVSEIHSLRGDGEFIYELERNILDKFKSLPKPTTKFEGYTECFLDDLRDHSDWFDKIFDNV